MTDYGTDLRLIFKKDGTVSLDPLFRTISGPQVVQQAVFNRLFTSKYDCWWDVDANVINLIDLINAKFSNSDLRKLTTQIERVVMDDPRVRMANVQVQTSGTLNFDIRIEISFTLIDGETFDSVFTLSEGGVTVA